MSTPPSLSLQRDDLSDAEGEWPEKLISALTSFGNQTQDAFDRNVSIQDNMNATVKTVQIAMQDDWIAPTLLNSWVNHDPPNWESAGYRKRNGLVEARGLIKNGTLGAAAYRLPVGYRPEKGMVVVCDSNGAHGRLDIYSNGNVIPISGSTAWFSVRAMFAPSDPSPIPNPVFPVVFKPGLKGTARPLLVRAIDALDVTDKASGVHVSTTVTWQPSGDSVRIEDLPGLYALRTYKVTFLIIGE